MGAPVIRWMRPRLDEDARGRALAAISPLERDRYDAAPEPRRTSFLAGRLLLRELVAELTGTDPSAVDLVATCPDCGGPHGRPVLVGGDLHLSLSHSAGAVVAAASWGAPVGVDLEPLEQPGAAVSAIGALTGEASLLRWTRVEAVLKADGRGLRVDPARVSLEVVDGGIEGRVAGAPARYRVGEVVLAPGIRASVAVAI